MGIGVGSAHDMIRKTDGIGACFDDIGPISDDIGGNFDDSENIVQQIE